MTCGGAHFWDKFVSLFQLRSIWSPSYSDPHQMEEDIGDLLALKSFNGGDKLTHKTMSYLNDR